MVSLDCRAVQYTALFSNDDDSISAIGSMCFGNKAKENDGQKRLKCRITQRSYQPLHRHLPPLLQQITDNKAISDTTLDVLFILLLIVAFFMHENLLRVFGLNSPTDCDITLSPIYITCRMHQRRDWSTLIHSQPLVMQMLRLQFLLVRVKVRQAPIRFPRWSFPDLDRSSTSLGCTLMKVRKPLFM